MVILFCLLDSNFLCKPIAILYYIHTQHIFVKIFFFDAHFWDSRICVVCSKAAAAACVHWFMGHFAWRRSFFVPLNVIWQFVCQVRRLWLICVLSSHPLFSVCVRFWNVKRALRPFLRGCSIVRGDFNASFFVGDCLFRRFCFDINWLRQLCRNLCITMPMHRLWAFFLSRHSSTATFRLP